MEHRVACRLRNSDCGLQIEVWKLQITKPKYQMVRQAHHPEPGRRANSNNPNSKFQTRDPPEFVPDRIITGGQRLVQRYGTTAVNVLVIGY